MEVGLSCAHPDYPSGAVIAILWSGLNNYMRQQGYDQFISYASMPMHGGSQFLPPYWHGAHEPGGVARVPTLLSAIESRDKTLNVPLPLLLKGHMHLSCHVCGEPACGPDFSTADLLPILPIALVNQRCARHSSNSLDPLFPKPSRRCFPP